MKLYSIVITLLLIQNITSKAQTLPPSQIDTLIHHHFADSNLVIIDVCTDLSYATGHIQNAIHRDLYQSSLIKDLDTMDKNKLYVLHCISGGRSSSVMNTMNSKGFKHVYDIQNGISNWESAHYPYTTDTTLSTVRFYSASEFKSKLQKANYPIIIDIRADSLFAKKHLQNAINIDTNVSKLSSSMTDKERSYFIYGESTSSIDSTFLYSSYLAKYKNISILKSGFDSWTAAGYPIYDKNTAQSTVSPVETIDVMITIKYSTSRIRLIPNSQIPLTYKLYSTSSILLKSGNFSSETLVDIESLPSEMYILMIQSKNTIKSFMFSK